jgi:thioredoxin-like negative regulator of GroEL
MFKALSIFTLVFFVMSMAGAAATATGTTATKATGNPVVEVTQLGQINKALQKGPVFLRLGAKWCPHCRAFGPTLNGLAKEYRGKATFMSADIDKSPNLAKYFGVKYIPDCTVIVGSKNGKYVYMQPNGKTTTDRSKARITGDQNKKVYEKILNFAIRK